jgi:hypothetical protein
MTGAGRKGTALGQKPGKHCATRKTVADLRARIAHWMSLTDKTARTIVGRRV